MQAILPGTAALAVAVIFYTWRAWQQLQSRRDRKLRDRVTYMLWVMAGQEENEVAVVH
jgi:hypothetical protein